MKITIAIDSFKGSLTSLEAGNAIRQGILNVYDDAQVCVRPLADGGEGTVEALTLGMGGILKEIEVTGPVGRPVVCHYGIVEEKKLAIIEMAGAAGITLLSEEEKNPMATTTCGVGEIIKDAISKGCRNFLIGIGGSVTNDGGIGMLQALGYGMLDANGAQVEYGAKGLSQLETITTDHVVSELKECFFRIACDVNNPLCGENGCSAVFGPQKGATQQMIEQMDQWLQRYADLSKKVFVNANKDYAGAGAAGGLGFAFLTYMNASLESGVKIVLEETNLIQYVQDADIVITGEGRLDAQTVMGKAPIGVAQIAKQHHKPVLAFAGSVTRDAVKCNDAGIDAFFPIIRTIETLNKAMDIENAKKNMMEAVEQVFRLIKKMNS
ncbi:glycerate kinase [Lachnospiraceae bacterium ZAX-1]